MINRVDKILYIFEVKSSFFILELKLTGNASIISEKSKTWFSQSNHAVYIKLYIVNMRKSKRSSIISAYLHISWLGSTMDVQWDTTSYAKYWYNWATQLWKYACFHLLKVPLLYLFIKQCIPFRIKIISNQKRKSI